VNIIASFAKYKKIIFLLYFPFFVTNTNEFIEPSSTVDLLNNANCSLFHIQFHFVITNEEILIGLNK